MRKPTAVKHCVRPVLAVVALLVLTSCGGAAAPPDPYGLATAGTITAGVSQGDAPFVSPDATGQPVGMLVDLNNVIAQRMGRKIVYKLTTISAGLSLVTAGQFDMMLADLTMSEDRKRSVAFTTPFYVDANDVLVQADSTLATADDLAGKRVGATVGSAQADFAQKSLPQAQYVAMQTNGAGVDQLLSGNLDGCVLSSVQAATVLGQHPGKLKVGLSVESGVPEAMAVNKKLTTFLDDYNRELAATVDDGTFLKLYQQYFPGVEYPSSMFRYWPSLQEQLAKAPR
jgi:polar amino acid transport system substrate-binding protein